MLRYTKLEHRFVQYIPDELEPAVLYISIEYATSAHGCCCGCGLQVITPFTPTDWKMTFDGETVSLWPSIGNWNFPCRSHYIIRQGRIVSAGPWKDERIEDGRQRDQKRKEDYFGQENKCEERQAAQSDEAATKPPGFWNRLKKRRGRKYR